MLRSVSELCQAAVARCDEAKSLHGEERRLYLLEVLNKLAAAVDVFASAGAKATVLPFRRNPLAEKPRPPGKEVREPNNGGRGR